MRWAVTTGKLAPSIHSTHLDYGLPIRSLLSDDLHWMVRVCIYFLVHGLLAGGPGIDNLEKK